jgi:hypothetical protein
MIFVSVDMLTWTSFGSNKPDQYSTSSITILDLRLLIWQGGDDGTHMGGVLSCWSLIHDGMPKARGVGIFDSANSNFEKVEKVDSNSNSAN